MDGNEETLSATREGIGDSKKQTSVGVVRKPSKGVNKKVAERASLITPTLKKKTHFVAARRKVADAKKAKEKITDLKTMPDESMEDSTDEELEEYLDSWLNHDVDSDELDPPTDNSETNEQDGEAPDMIGDFSPGNGIAKVSSLPIARKSINRTVTNYGRKTDNDISGKTNVMPTTATEKLKEMKRTATINGRSMNEQEGQVNDEQSELATKEILETLKTNATTNETIYGKPKTASEILMEMKQMNELANETINGLNTDNKKTNLEQILNMATRNNDGLGHDLYEDMNDNGQDGTELEKVGDLRSKRVFKKVSLHTRSLKSIYGNNTNNIEQDETEPEKAGDFGSGNDFNKASSLRRSVESTHGNNTKTGTNGTNEQTHTDINTATRNTSKTGTKVTTRMTTRLSGEEWIRPATSKILGISTDKTATNTTLKTNTLKIGPDAAETPKLSEAPSQKVYTYNVQLSFSRPLAAEGSTPKKGNFNVPFCFKQVIKQLNIFSPAIILYAYNTSGVPITNADQLPDEEIEDYITYYHNHHVTAGGQLTGMCCIEAPFPWYQIKDEKRALFRWLRDKGVFMKYVSFKADQVAASGWFYGLPSDVLRKDDALLELKSRLGDRLPKDLHIQLVPRPLSITDKISRNRFSFKGIAVECERKRVRELQEILYGMESPAEAQFKYSLTGRALFVPFIESDVWPNAKILGMAKMHIHEMNKLEQIFLQNVKNIDQPLTWYDGDVESLREMLTNCTTSDGFHMIHSVHNTNRPGTITLLYYKDFKKEVHNYFPDIQRFLEEQLAEESKSKIAIEGKTIVMTGRQNPAVSSNASKEYSSYADLILEGMNPQGGEEEKEEIRSPPRKKPTQKKTPPRMSYSQIANPKRNREVNPKRNREANQVNQTSSIASSGNYNSEEFTDSEGPPITISPQENNAIRLLEERLNKMQEQFETRFGCVEGTDMETTKMLIEENNIKMQKISEEYFDKKFQETTELILARFTAITEKQNTNILAIQTYVTQQIQTLLNNNQTAPQGSQIAPLIPPPLQPVAMPGTQQEASDRGT